VEDSVGERRFEGTARVYRSLSEEYYSHGRSEHGLGSWARLNKERGGKEGVLPIEASELQTLSTKGGQGEDASPYNGEES